VCEVSSVVLSWAPSEASCHGISMYQRQLPAGDDGGCGVGLVALCCGTVSRRGRCAGWRVRTGLCCLWLQTRTLYMHVGEVHLQPVMHERATSPCRPQLATCWPAGCVQQQHVLELRVWSGTGTGVEKGWSGSYCRYTVPGRRRSTHSMLGASLATASSMPGLVHLPRAFRAGC
jgi:hypothetical protein